MKTLLTAALAILVLGAAPAYTGAPDVTLASEFIGSGGGAGSFSAIRAFDRMIGGDAVLAQEQSLRAAFGAAPTDRFVREFSYAVSDAWTTASQMNVKLPNAPSSGGDSALARMIVRAGITPSGTFSTTYLFSHLFSAAVTSNVMQDIDTRFGAGSSASFAQMGDRFFAGVARTVNVALVQPGTR